MRLLTRCADPQDVERAVTGALQVVDELIAACIEVGAPVASRPCQVLVVSPDDTVEDVVRALLDARALAALGLERVA